VKLATLRDGTRDGRLAVVSRDLSRAVHADGIAKTLQQALDDWPACSSQLAALAARIEQGTAAEAFSFNPAQAMAPLPRAHHWVDGSAYVNHVELVRKARGAEMPESFWTDPLVYQGGSDDFLGPTQDAPFVSEDWGIDLEAEVAVVTDDVPMSADPLAARRHIRLVMLVNDWSLRNLIRASWPRASASTSPSRRPRSLPWRSRPTSWTRPGTGRKSTCRSPCTSTAGCWGGRTPAWT